jgi:hypothetical protein
MRSNPYWTLHSGASRSNNTHSLTKNYSAISYKDFFFYLLTLMQLQIRYYEFENELLRHLCLKTRIAGIHFAADRQAAGAIAC